VVWNIVWRFLLVFLVLAALLFGVAGRADLPMFWAFLAVFFGVGTVGALIVQANDPTLLRERFKPAEQGKDPYMRPVALASALVSLSLAAWDAGRAHWSSVPRWTQIAALVVMAGAHAVWMWAMSVNRFFSSAVRIQRDRGHSVITGGPYRFVRHPGYAVLLLLLPAVPVGLGSWWAVLPMLPLMAVLLWRVKIEDRLLRAELEGYESYAAGVRYRLVPGLW
jgi:protein-S-isoprenylcysteine O-methyltransferase Ste14